MKSNKIRSTLGRLLARLALRINPPTDIDLDRVARNFMAGLHKRGCVIAPVQPRPLYHFSACHLDPMDRAASLISMAVISSTAPPEQIRDFVLGRIITDKPHLKAWLLIAWDIQPIPRHLVELSAIAPDPIATPA